MLILGKGQEDEAPAGVFFSHLALNGCAFFQSAGMDTISGIWGSLTLRDVHQPSG